MQSETQKMSNQQGTQDAARDTAKREAKKESTGPEFPSADAEEPVLDEQDMKENNLKEEDLDNIVWDKPAQPDEDLNKTENDITD